jgi:hypothetical protein
MNSAGGWAASRARRAFMRGLRADKRSALPPLRPGERDDLVAAYRARGGVVEDCSPADAWMLGDAWEWGPRPRGAGRGDPPDGFQLTGPASQRAKPTAG